MNEELHLRVNLVADDLRELRHDRHENVGAWIGFIFVLLLLSSIECDAKFLLMVIASIVFAASEISRHRLLSKALRAWEDVGESVYTFETGGLSVSHSKGMRRYDWSTIVSYRDYKSALVLNYLDLHTMLIPKRCLATGEYERICDVLKCACVERQTTYARPRSIPGKQNDT